MAGIMRVNSRKNAYRMWTEKPRKILISFFLACCDVCKKKNAYGFRNVKHLFIQRTHIKTEKN